MMLKINVNKSWFSHAVIDRQTDSRHMVTEETHIENICLILKKKLFLPVTVPAQLERQSSRCSKDSDFPS